MVLFWQLKTEPADSWLTLQSNLLAGNYFLQSFIVAVIFLFFTVDQFTYYLQLQSQHLKNYIEAGQGFVEIISPLYRVD